MTFPAPLVSPGELQPPTSAPVMDSGALPSERIVDPIVNRARRQCSTIPRRVLADEPGIDDPNNARECDGATAHSLKEVAVGCRGERINPGGVPSPKHQDPRSARDGAKRDPVYAGAAAKMSSADVVEPRALRRLRDETTAVGQRNTHERWKHWE